MSRDKKRLVKLFSSASGALRSQKQNRNALCKCNSGKKAKNCCGCETEYFKPKAEKVEDDRNRNNTEL